MTKIAVTQGDKSHNSGNITATTSTGQSTKPERLKKICRVLHQLGWTHTGQHWVHSNVIEITAVCRRNANKVLFGSCTAVWRVWEFSHLNELNTDVLSQRNVDGHKFCHITVTLKHMGIHCYSQGEGTVPSLAVINYR